MLRQLVESDLRTDGLKCWAVIPSFTRLHIIVLFLMVVMIAAIAGVPLARKFLRGLARGTNLYVIVTVDGRTFAYKAPPSSLIPMNTPLAEVPQEILASPDYETYYNICWFDGLGTLHRCGHDYHRTEEMASYCRLNSTAHSFIGKILEQR